MTSDEYRTNFIQAAVNVFGLRTVSQGDYFKMQQLFSEPLYSVWVGRPGYKDLPLSDEDKSLLEMLAGPHGRTIYLAACIKRGLEP